jgi:hypothetical protein
VISAKEILTNNVNLKKIKNNDNNDKKKLNNNDNIDNNDIKLLNVKKHRVVELIAKDLVDKLNSPNSYKLFCKIAYKNPEPIISRCLGLTLESVGVRNKGGYFVTLIKEYGEL